MSPLDNAIVAVKSPVLSVSLSTVRVISFLFNVRLSTVCGEMPSWSGVVSVDSMDGVGNCVSVAKAVTFIDNTMLSDSITLTVRFIFLRFILWIYFAKNTCIFIEDRITLYQMGAYDSYKITL